MWRVLIAFVLVLTCVTGIVTARPVEFNVDLFCGWDGYYRPMEWTPAEVGISTDLTEPFDGSFTLSAQQDGLNTLNVVHNIVLTPDVPLSLPLVTKFAAHLNKCTLTIRDRRGRTRWRTDVDLWDYSAGGRLLRIVQEQDMLVGLVGQAQFGLLRLRDATVCTSPHGSGTVYVGNKVPRMMPWDWTGFVSLDLLVLYDPDWSLLRPQQLKAVRDWVSNGGALLLILGRHPVPPDSAMSELIPFNVGDLRTGELPADALADWGLDAARSETVTAWSLSPKPSVALSKKTEAPGGGYLYGVGRVGFGRVGVLGFDPSNLSAEQTRHTASFWTRHIAACLAEPPGAPAVTTTSLPPGQTAACRRSILLKEQIPEGARMQSMNENLYRIGVAQDASNRVMEHLYQLRQMRPLSIWWVILTLSALAVLLGPVDYLVLKKLDKLPYTWLTCTGWIVIFTVGAYYGVQYLRGGTMQLRAVSVIDSVADSNHAWATYYTGLFAPRSEEYRLEGLKAGQWWAGVAPSREEIWTYQRETGTRQLYCFQDDGANLPFSVPVNIWTVQTLLGESSLDGSPFTVTVRHDRDTAAVEIANASGSRIVKGVVLWANHFAEFGSVPARSTQAFDVPVRPFDAWGNDGRYSSPGRYPGMPQQVSTPRYPPTFTDSLFLAQGCLNRTLAMHESLRLGAALVCVMYEDAPAPFTVRNRSYDVNHILYARQLVYERRE